MITRKDEQTIEIREQMRGGAKQVEIRNLACELPAKARLFGRLRLIPGASIGYHVHEGETELFYFLSGAGRVRDGEQWFDVQPGDVLSTGNGNGHAVENTGDEDLVFIAVIVKD